MNTSWGNHRQLTSTFSTTRHLLGQAEHHVMINDGLLCVPPQLLKDGLDVHSVSTQDHQGVGTTGAFCNLTSVVIRMGYLNVEKPSHP